MQKPVFYLLVIAGVAVALYAALYGRSVCGQIGADREVSAIRGNWKRAQWAGPGSPAGPAVTAKIKEITEAYFKAQQRERENLAQVMVSDCVLKSFLVAITRTVQYISQIFFKGCKKKEKPDQQGGDLTLCLRPLLDDPNFHQPVLYLPKAACAANDFCNGRGACFLGKCFCNPGWSGPGCSAKSAIARGRCAMNSDECYRHPTYGRTVIPLERWKRAQWAETAWWTAEDHQADKDDHAGATISLFEGYKNVPEDLGDGERPAIAATYLLSYSWP
jgi:hypothetical protein